MEALIDGLSTIRFYIILKPFIKLLFQLFRLSTIRFYIILKLIMRLVPGESRLSTIRFYIILKQPERKATPEGV